MNSDTPYDFEADHKVDAPKAVNDPTVYGIVSDQRIKGMIARLEKDFLKEGMQLMREGRFDETLTLIEQYSQEIERLRSRLSDAS